MRAAMEETQRRREKQDAYNKAHGIVPQTIRKDVRKVLEISKDAQQEQQAGRRKLTDAEREATIRRLEKEMKEASKMLEFEYAALLRDQIIALRGRNEEAPCPMFPPWISAAWGYPLRYPAGKGPGPQSGL